MPLWGAVGYAKEGVDLLACWKGQFSRQKNGDIWNAIALCHVDYLEGTK